MSIDKFSSPDFTADGNLSAVQELNLLKAANVIALIDCIEKVEKVKPEIFSDLYTYYFTISGKVFALTSDHMTSPTLFFQRYYEEFDVMPPRELNGRMVWGLFLRALKEAGKLKIRAYDDFTAEDYDVELFVGVLRKMQIIEDPKRLKKNRNLLFRCEEGLCLPAETPKTIFENEHLKSDISRISKRMTTRGMLITKRKSVRIGPENNDVVACWLFDPGIE